MKRGSTTYRLLAALFGGIVLALALPGLHWWPLALLFPLFVMEALEGDTRWWKGALLGLVAGTLHWMLSTYWILPLLRGYGAMSTPVAWACLCGMGIVLGSTWAMVFGMLATFPRGLRPLVFPALWIVVEALRSFPPYQFPWNSTAACLSGTPALLPSLAIWSAPGLGWALMSLGSGLWAVWQREYRKEGVVLISVAGGLALLFSLIAPEAEPAGAEIRVAALQPGTLLEERWDPSNWRRLSENVRKMSIRAGASHPKMILWPESAMPFRFDTDQRYREQVFSLSRELGATIVLNSVASGPRGGLRNSVFAVTPAGAVSRYDKMHLVPFGEYVPRWARFFFPGSLVHEVGQFQPGREVTLLNGGIRLGISVCYEIVFPRLCAAESRQGAEVLVTLTNDGWYGRSWALHQHFAQAVLRAVETRRWVVRAALTGISGSISPDGQVQGRLGPGELGILETEFQPMRGLTPASRFPDAWNLVCLFSLILSFLFRKRLSPQSKRPASRRPQLRQLPDGPRPRIRV